MPFEPLETDEPYTGPKRANDDMDSAMLVGCTGFVVNSILGYGLAVWPWFAIKGAEELRNVLLCLALGGIPAAVLGVFGTRRWGLAGACGFFAGAVTTGIFLYLRLQQVFVAALAKQAPAPDYPDVLVALVPLGYGVSIALLAGLTVPRREFALPTEP